MLTRTAVICWRTELCSKLLKLRVICWLRRSEGQHLTSLLQESCYSRAVSLTGCSADDLECQCAPVKQAGIALAGGPCFLGNCDGTDLSSFSSAWTAACATATVSTSMLKSAVAAQATPDDTNTGGKTIQMGAIQTGTSQDETSQMMGDTNEITIPRRLGAVAITAIALGLSMMGIGAGVIIYCLSMVRKRRHEKRRWKALEREKTAMQASLEELKRAVSQQNTLDMAEHNASGRTRPKTILVNWKDGPQELMVPEKVFHELPASPAAWEKM